METNIELRVLRYTGVDDNLDIEKKRATDLYISAWKTFQMFASFPATELASFAPTMPDDYCTAH